LIGERQKNILFLVVITLVVVLLLAWVSNISYDYPYYFIWDMDHITTLDVALIHSGFLPDHMNHTGFGMYLSLFLTEKIAHLTDFLSALDLKDIAGSLNPLAVMAERTEFVRRHSPFLVVVIPILLCLAIYLAFDISRWYFVLFLVVLGTQESLSYHASMVRTELYSVFFWASAFLVMVIALRATKPIVKWLSLLMTGVLIGLSFLTKIQSLFYLAALLILIILLFSFSQDNQTPERLDISQKATFGILVVSFFSVLSFLLLGIFSYSTHIPRGIPTWASAFCITPMAAAFFLAFVSLFLVQLFLYRTKRTSSQVFMFSSFFSIIALGFILSFLFHFFLYSNVAVSLKYMLLDFKMLFLRQCPYIPDLSLNIPKFGLKRILLELRFNPILFTVSILLNLLLVIGFYFQFVRITKGQLILCLLITVLAFVNIVVGTRYQLRDILWKEVLLNLLNLIYFTILVTRSTRYRSTLVKVGCSLLIILFFVNCIHAYNMPERIDANYNQYGWKEDKWFSSAYIGNQQKYRNIMLKKYNNTTAWVAKSVAVDHKRIRRTVDFVFKNQTITHRNIGIVFEGFPPWTADLDYKIKDAPSAIKGAILVDNASIELERGTFFKKEYVSVHSSYLDKLKKFSPRGRLSVLTRRDLQIFLFVHADDVSRLLSNEIVQTPHKIILQKNEHSLELQGLQIKNYCEIPLNRITQKFFFVIQKT